MREIRLYGSEGGGAARSPYPYQGSCRNVLDSRLGLLSAGVTFVRGSDTQGNSCSGKVLVIADIAW